MDRSRDRRQRRSQWIEMPRQRRSQWNGTTRQRRSKRILVPRERLGIALLAALLTLAAAPAGAAADRTSNEAATRAYVLADNALASASEHNVPKITGRLASYKRKLLRECPRVASESPENSESYRMSYEVAGALWSISYGTDAQAIARFAASVDRLRWSDPKITRLAREYAATLKQLAALPEPAVCAEIRAWRASGYATVPAHALSFDRLTEALVPYVLPVSLLHPYLTAADRPVESRTQALEKKLLDTETLIGGTTWYDVLEVLDLNN